MGRPASLAEGSSWAGLQLGDESCGPESWGGVSSGKNSTAPLQLSAANSSEETEVLRVLDPLWQFLQKAWAYLGTDCPRGSP